MLNAFYNPADAVLDAKKLGDWASTVLVMVCSGILIALAPMLIFREIFWKMSLIALVSFIGGAFLGGLFMKIVFSILGAKNPGYFEAVTSIVLGAAPFSAAIFIGSVLNLIPKVGLMLFALLAVIGGITMAAAHLRAVKELMSVDLLTAVMGTWIIAGVGVTMAYFAYSLAMMSELISVLLLLAAA